jgi:hypothetical protein
LILTVRAHAVEPIVHTLFVLLGRVAEGAHALFFGRMNPVPGHWGIAVPPLPDLWCSPPVELLLFTLVTSIILLVFVLVYACG